MKKYIWLLPLLFGLNVILMGCDEPTTSRPNNHEFKRIQNERL